MRPTIVWGPITDQLGLVHFSHIRSKDLGEGHLRVWKEEEFRREPPDAYASRHPAPMPLKWHHNERIGTITRLRRDGKHLFAVGESLLDPEALQILTEEHGKLRFSSSTNRLPPLTIREVSLTGSPRSVGLHEVRWCRPGDGRGRLPLWVRQELDRKVETRSSELAVHEVGQGSEEVGDWVRSDVASGQVYHSGVLGQVLGVNGRPVRRS